MKGDEDMWEVLIRSDELDFEASVKIGRDEHSDDLPIIIADILSDKGMVQRSGEGGDYAFFHRIPKTDGD